jgi:hypothetical protein
MAVAAQSDTKVEDFKGLIDVIEDSLEFAEIQTNLQVVVIGEMSVRPGVRQVTFEDES